ncbi:hypothetical protein ACFL0M_11105 [Thermodesulfobacteriota bacterium]
MKKRFVVLYILFFLFYLKGLAAADYLGQKFDDMDSSHDDRVSWEEYKDYLPYPKAADFKSADLNKDNEIELFEWVSYQSQKDPQLAVSKYHYKNKYGQLYKHKEGFWYKRKNEFWYQYRNERWLKYSRAHPYRDWHDDWYWDHARWYDHDWDYYGYRFGFRYGHGCRYGCW